MFRQLYLARSCYGDVCKTMSDIETGKYRLYRPSLGSLVFYFMQFVAVVRLLLLSYNIKQIEADGDSSAYFDSYMVIVARINQLYDSLFYVTTSPLYLSGAALHFLMYYTLDRTGWTDLHCLIVQNRDQFLRANPALVFKIPRQQFFVNVYRQIGRLLATIKNGQFKQTRALERYPNLSAKDQFRLFLLCDAYEWQIWFFQFLILTSTILGFVSRLHMYSNLILPPQALLYLFCFLISNKSGAFLALSQLLFCLSAIAEYRKLRTRISWAIVRSKLGHQTRFYGHIVGAQAALYRHLFIYRADHTRITNQLLHINEQLISPCAFVYFICNIMFNAYANVFLHYGNPVPKLYRALVFILMMQILVPMLGLLLMTRVNRHIKSSTSCLAFILARLAQTGHPRDGYYIREHWKAHTYYELLHRRHNQLQLTVGSLGSMRSKSILNFALFYSSYIMYFCGKFMVKSE